MSIVLLASVGLAVGGLPGAFLGAVVDRALAARRRASPPAPDSRLVMLLLLVGLRSGLSVLAALQRASLRLADHHELRKVARVATVAGLTAAISEAGPGLRPLIAQLARAQRSGASLTAAVRRILEQDLARERTERIARARSLPMRLMIPVTLLMLPGVVLLVYAPALVRTFDQLIGAWS